MPRYALTGEKLTTRGRYCYLTDADKEDFSRLLREAWPEGYFEDWSVEGQHPVRDSLAACGQISGFNIPFAGRVPGGHGNWHHLHVHFHLDPLVPFDMSKPRPPRRRTEYISGQWVTREVHDEFPTVDFRGRYFGWDEMSCVFRAEDVEAKAAASKVFRLSTKFMSNALDVVDVAAGRVIEHIPDSTDWAGPDLLRLCQQDPTVFTSVRYSPEQGIWKGYRPVPKLRRRHKNSQR